MADPQLSCAMYLWALATTCGMVMLIVWLLTR